MNQQHPTKKISSYSDGLARSAADAGAVRSIGRADQRKAAKEMVDRSQIDKHVLAIEKGDEAARRLAIQALRRHEAQDWATAPQAVCHTLVVSLRGQLLDTAKPPLILRDVATILGNMGAHSKAALPQLVDLLRDGVPDVVRETVALALGKCGAQARDAVGQLLVLAQGHNALAVQAIRALGQIGCADQRVKTVLLELWTTPTHTQDCQLQLATALCRLGIEARGVLEFFTRLLMGSPENSLRKAAAAALAWRNKKDQDAVPALLSAVLADKDEEVRQIAQASLDQLRLSQEAAIAICVKQLDGSAYAETALRKSGERAVPALIEALGAQESGVRLKAARVLAHLGELAAAGAPALTSMLTDRDSEIRLTAAKGLWNITKRPELVVPVLIQLMDSKSAPPSEDAEAQRRFTQTVIEALWRIGPPAQAAIPALNDKTKDRNRLISESAREALQKIGPLKGK